METNHSYELREWQGLNAQLAAVDKQSLADRKSAQVDMLQAMIERNTLIERIEWCLTGNYGYGAMQRMRQIAAARRGNRAAQAVQIIGALEYQCPARLTAEAWHKLSVDQQAGLGFAVLDALNNFIKAD